MPHKSTIVCKYCKKLGHSIDKFYKLQGFPPNFKSNRFPPPRRSVAHVEVDTFSVSAMSAGLEGTSAPEQSYPVPGFTQGPIFSANATSSAISTVFISIIYFFNQLSCLYQLCWALQ